MQEFGYYTLFGAGENKGNHCEATVIIKQTFRNSTYSEADFTPHTMSIISINGIENREGGLQSFNVGPPNID